MEAIGGGEISLKELEDRVWQDVAQARSSYEVIASFLRPLALRCNSHWNNKYLPLTNSLWIAAFDSLVMSLSRLLQSPTTSSQCTLATYRNHVLQELREKGPRRNEAQSCKECYGKLCDRHFLKELRRRHSELLGKVGPVRNQLIAHSDSQFDRKMLKKEHELYLGESVAFVEETHRTLQSALEDTSMFGPYLSHSFKGVAEDWLGVLSKRDSRKDALNARI